MGLFGNRQDEIARALAGDVDALRSEVSRLRDDLASVRSQLQAAQQDVAETATRVYRHLKAVQAAARRATEGDESNQAPAGAAPPVTPTLPPAFRTMTGARARRLQRLHRPDPTLDLAADSEETNGVHP